MIELSTPALVPCTRYFSLIRSASRGEMASPISLSPTVASTLSVRTHSRLGPYSLHSLFSNSMAALRAMYAFFCVWSLP